MNKDILITNNKSNDQNRASYIRTLLYREAENQYNEKRTLRQLFYQLLPKLSAHAGEKARKKNWAQNTYKALSKELSKLVLKGELTYHQLGIIEEERANRIQVFPDHSIEVWFEKNSLFEAIKPVSNLLQITIYSCKGFQSTNVLKEFEKRAKNIDTVFLITDWDPSGVCIAKELQKRAIKLGIDTEFIRIGINPEHIPEERRIASLVQIKHTDSRAKKFIEKYGEQCYEVQALDNREIRELVVKALLDYGLDFKISAHNRLEENQYNIAYLAVEGVLEELKSKLKENALEFVQRKDKRKVTEKDIINAIIENQELLENDWGLINSCRDYLEKEVV
ncbi:MAG: hypothetical protein ACE5KE_08260 [Methanosarcinales archaeon]